IEHRPQQLLPGMSLREVAVGRVNCRLSRRHGKDQPPVPDIDRAKSEYVREECAICLRVLAVEQDVRSKNHVAKYTPVGSGCRRVCDLSANCSAFSAVTSFFS